MSILDKLALPRDDHSCYGDVCIVTYRKEVRFQLDPKTPFDIVVKELKHQCGFKREQQFTLKWLDIDGKTLTIIIILYSLYMHVRMPNVVYMLAFICLCNITMNFVISNIYTHTQSRHEYRCFEIFTIRSIKALFFS